MWRILLAALLVPGGYSHGMEQEILRSQYASRGNTTFPVSVHATILRRPMALATTIPNHIPSCPFLPGNPSSGLAYGAHDWSGHPSTQDTWHNIQIPLNIVPSGGLDLVRMHFENPRKNKADDKGQLWHSKHNFATAIACRALISHSNCASATTINSEYFGIEPARNGEPIRELDRVPAAGWSVAVQS